jgi:hypothetical protein
MKKSSLASVSTIILLILMCVPPVFGETILSLEDFESPLRIDSDASLTINVGEKATLQNDINIYEESGRALVRIVNHGELTIKAKINCTGANLTIQNTGKLTLQDENINITDLANLNVVNESEMVIRNYLFDVNFGGTVTLDSSQGTLTVDNSYMDAIGSFNGHLSTIAVTTGKTTWVNSGMNCVGANLTIKNTGELTLRDEVVSISGWGNLSVINEGEMFIHNQTIGVYAGYCYITNNGNLTTEDWYLKDQNDGTVFTNNGNANLTHTSFIANGAAGKHIIVNRGNLQLTQCQLDTNYGGLISLDSRQGTLNVDNSILDSNGSSHGNQSTIELTTGKTTWTNTTLSTRSASLVYSDHGTDSTVQNCTFSNISYNVHGQTSITKSTLTNNNLTNQGNLALTTCTVTQRNTTIENSNHMEIVNTQFVSEETLNFENLGTIDCDNWMLQTKATGDALLTNKGTITFIQPFIEDTRSQELVSLGAAPTSFSQRSGGDITVINQGIIQTAQTTPSAPSATSTSTPTPTVTPTSTATPTMSAPSTTPTPTNTPATTNMNPTPTPTNTPTSPSNPTPSPYTTPTNTPTPATNTQTDESPPFVYIGLALGAVFVLLIIVVVWKRKKKDAQNS